ncbi:MAG TPA: hypothetical protein DDW17_01810, partial [Deltaproteobacteria bacterium]|nr:hypothetical protein [Deltaproteobacteria bacterium]
MRTFFKNPGNLRYNLNTIIPLVVFLTNILAIAVALYVLKGKGFSYVWVFGTSLFSAFCALLVILAMTQPIEELIQKAEKLVRFEEARKEKGQMMEVYQLIERLVERIKSEDEFISSKEKKVMGDIDKLDFIIPLGYMSLTVAHEVRNPLNTITGMTELLNQKITDDAQREYLSAILYAARKIDRFTTDLLEFTDNELTKEEFSIHEVIEEALNSLRMEYRNALYEFQKDEDIIYTGDRIKIYQTIHNILKNAFEFEKDSGYIRIDTKQDNERVLISIYNRNSRILEEDLPSMFKPFFSRKKGGRGLGLFNSMKNIKLHGGDILVESGLQGTTF